jgi:hypothetical protein
MRWRGERSASLMPQGFMKKAHVESERIMKRSNAKVMIRSGK